MNAPALPRIMAIAAENAGIEAVIRASKALGGKRIYIPSKAAPNDPLTLAVGLKAAEAICAAVGGDTFEFPRGHNHIQWLIVQDLVARKASANVMVSVLKVTHRHARRLRRRALGRKKAEVEIMDRRVRDPRQLDIEDLLGRT